MEIQFNSLQHCTGKMTVVKNSHVTIQKVIWAVKIC